MDKPLLLVLSDALEETKPLATRDRWSASLRRSYVLLHLAFRAARHDNLASCRSYLDRALSGIIQSDDIVSCSSDLLKVYKDLGHQLQAA